MVSGLAGRGRRRQGNENLGWRLPGQVGVVEVAVEAHKREAVPLGDDILVRVVEVEPLSLHGGGDGLQASRRNRAEHHMALNEQVVDELVELCGAFLPAQDDADGVEREMAHGQKRGVQFRDEPERLLCLGLVEQVFEPNVRIDEVHRSVAPPFEGFVLEFD